MSEPHRVRPPGSTVTLSEYNMLLAEVDALRTENAAREQIIENIVYAIEGKSMPHEAFVDNAIVKRAVEALARRTR